MFAINLLVPLLPPNLLPVPCNNGVCSFISFWCLILLFCNILPTDLPLIPPMIPLATFAISEWPNAVLAPAATPEPTLAPKWFHLMILNLLFHP